MRTSSPTSSRASPAASARGGRAYLGLALWLALAALQIAFAYGLSQGATTDRDALYEYRFAVGSVFAYAVFVGLTFAVAATYDRPLEALGLRRFRRRWLWLAFGAVFVSLVVGVIVEVLLHTNAGEQQGLIPEVWRPDRLMALVVNSLVVVTVVPFSEELFFRGLGVQSLRLLGSATAVAGTALVFALAHGIAAALPPLFVFGVGLAWVRLRSDSVWPGVIAHGSYNALVLALGLSTL